MKKRSLLLFLILILLLAGCGKQQKEEEKTPEGLFAILESLDHKDSELGLEQYESISQIEDGRIDEDLIGTWMNTDKSITYVFDETGILHVSIPLYSIETEMPYVCLEREGVKIFAADAEVIAYEGSERIEYREFEASCYKLENNALYFAEAEKSGESFVSYYVSLVALYKADEKGDISESLLANPVSLKALCGKWQADAFTMELGTDSISFRQEENSVTYPVSISEGNRLEIDVDGKVSGYGISVALIKDYEENQTVITRDLLLDYTGKNKRDIPNLTEYLTDWHETYAYVPYYYSMSFVEGK